MATTQYIGARYVPIFADPAEWNNTRTYEPLTIVMHDGNSYTSRQYVPKGIDISNEDFWALTGNYNAQVEAYRQDVERFATQVNEISAALNTETNRATKAEETLQNNINTETNRATKAESVLPVCVDYFDEIATSEFLESGRFFQTTEYKEGCKGGCLYKIVNATNALNDGLLVVPVNEELSAQVIFSESIDVNTLGADPTGVNDSYSVLQKAINYAHNNQVIASIAAGISTTLNINAVISISLNGIYKCSEKLITYPGVNILGNGSAIHFASDGIEVQKTSELANIGRSNQSFVIAEKLKLIGTGLLGTGISFNSEQAATVQGLTFNNVVVENFNKGVVISNNTYTTTFNTCGFNQNNICTSIECETNGGERISFNESSFANSNVCINSSAVVNNDIYFNCCSIDYIIQKIVSENARGAIYFNNSHIECNAAEDMIVNSRLVAFNECYMHLAANNCERLCVNTGVIKFLGCNISSFYYNYIADTGLVALRTCTRPSATKLPSYATPNNFKIKNILTANATISISDKIITVTATSTKMTFGYIFDENDFMGWNATINTSISGSFGYRIASGIHSANNAIAYMTSKGSRNLTDDEKGGLLPIVCTTTNASVGVNNDGFIINVPICAVGDTFTIDLNVLR